MKRMLFNATYSEEFRVATVDEKKLINFDIETVNKTQRRGNIYKGTITRVESSLEACFVDYGVSRQGFLPFKEIDHALINNIKNKNYNALEGKGILVQVEKDERGNKGAALTSIVSLPGRYLVLMTNNSRASGISRRISGEERDDLKKLLSSLEIPQGMSIIARTAALGRTVEDLQWDLDYLIKLWATIFSASEVKEKNFLIYQESNIIVRSIRDHFKPDIDEILIDVEEVYQEAKDFMSHVMPDYTHKIKFYNDDVPLFSKFQIEHQIDTAYGRMVNLPSGGSIVIDCTEALTAIDVNSAKANKGNDIEATAFSTNMEAAEEITRQMRLRDLGGLIVVDFIDMEISKNQRDLELYFKHQLSMDRARVQMGKLSKFGLMEISRERVQISLEESTTYLCPRCSGVGIIRGIESSSIHILRMIQEEIVTKSVNLSQLHIQLPVSVATYLLNEKRIELSKIENKMKISIVLIPNVNLESPNYKIKKIFQESLDLLSNKKSFNFLEKPEENLDNQKFDMGKDHSNENKPVIKNIKHSEPAPMIKKLSIITFIKNLFSIKSTSIKNNNVTTKKNNSELNKDVKLKLNNKLNNKNAPTHKTVSNINRPSIVKNDNPIDKQLNDNVKPKAAVKHNDSKHKIDNKFNKTVNKTNKNSSQQPTLNNVNGPDKSNLIADTTVKNIINPSEKSEDIKKPEQTVELKDNLTQPNPHNNVDVVKPTNNIMKDIDLGSYKLIDTDTSRKVETVNDVHKTHLKRYNDVPDNIDVNKTDDDFIIVETKNLSNIQK